MKCIVRPLEQEDAGRGLAAVDTNTAEDLDVGTGDFIAIIANNGRGD